MEEDKNGRHKKEKRNFATILCTLAICLVLQHFSLTNISEYEKGCLFMLVYLCVNEILKN